MACGARRGASPDPGLDTVVKHSGSIERFESAAALVDAAVDDWLKWVGPSAEPESGQSENPHRTVALSGGRITRNLFRASSAAARARGVSFSRLEFFWADERCVPPDHSDSNYLMAARELLTPMAIDPARVHRVRGELDPAAAALQAETTMRSVLQIGPDVQPILDLVFLGMGEDGHVASLFPGAPVEVTECASVYLPVVAVKPPPHRVTLNFATLAAAREVWVIVSGDGKEQALAESVRDDGTTPLARVLRDRERAGGATRILTDCGPVGDR